MPGSKGWGGSAESSPPPPQHEMLSTVNSLAARCERERWREMLSDTTAAVLSSSAPSPPPSPPWICPCLDDVNAVQAPGCGPRYPEDPAVSGTSIWSTIFVSLVGIAMLILFQFTFCYLLRRRHLQQAEAENAVMRRLLELLEGCEEDFTRTVYFAVEQPDGEAAAARRCDDEEQTPGPDGKPPMLPAPVLVSAGGGAGGEAGAGVGAGAGAGEGAGEQQQRTESRRSEARDDVDGINGEGDGEPSVAVVMGLDQAESEEARRRRRGGLMGRLDRLVCAMGNPMTWLAPLSRTSEPREFEPDAFAPANAALNMRQVFLTRLREQQARMPQSIVSHLREQQRNEQMAIWNQIQLTRPPPPPPQQQPQHTGGASGSGSGTSEGGREGADGGPAESPVQDVVIGGFDGVHGTGSFAHGSRRSLDNVMEAERRRGTAGEGGLG